MKRIKFFGLFLSLVTILSTPNTQFLSSSNNNKTDKDISHNDNINAFIRAQEILGKNVEIIGSNSTIVDLLVSDSYGKQLLYEFNYMNNYVESVNLYKKDNPNLKKAIGSKNLNNSCFYTYESGGQLSSIVTDDSTYQLSYNDSGLINKQTNNGKDIIIKTYDKDLLTKISYINGTVAERNYNDSGLKLSSSVNGRTVSKFEYTSDLLTKYEDLQTKTTYNYEYNENNHVTSMFSSDGLEVAYTYDENNESITKRNYRYIGSEIETVNTTDGILSNYLKISTKKDISDRILKKNYLLPNGKSLIEDYSYVEEELTYDELAEENYESIIDNRSRDTKVKLYKNSIDIFTYLYDDENNIITDSNSKSSNDYVYSTNGELITHKDKKGEANFIYDSRGNIIYKGDYKLQYSLSDGFDQLISYDGKIFKYDSNGNPTTYKNNKLKWEGKNLTDFALNKYTYNESGVRTSKTVDGITTKYQLEGNKVIFEIREDQEPITFLYNNNEVVGFIYSESPYMYQKNLQRDVLNILDSEGNVVVNYEYDPWGKLLNTNGSLSSTIGKINPYLYRSYRYDYESSLYYLGSRYYDPEIGRFISADDTANLKYTILSDLSSKNLYVYANNNPVNMIDPQGNMSHGILNTLKILYSDLRVMNDATISTPCLVLNANNLYQGFHETAQLVAAKQLSKANYITKLEYNTSNGYADILAYKGINYLFEVKPTTTSTSAAITQLGRYISATRFKAGPDFTEAEIDFLPKIKMKVYSQGSGIIRYAFYKEKWQWFNKHVKIAVEESKVEQAIKIGFWVGVAIAGTIIVATLVEDVITAGAGIADDVASVGVASSAFRTAVYFGLAFI